MQWGLGEISLLRSFRERRLSFNNIARAFNGAHTRDEVVEAYWATVRFADNYEATMHVGGVLLAQQNDISLVNGKPWAKHGDEAGSFRRPMF